MGAALDWALDHDAETALGLAVALAPWWFTRGRPAKGYRRLAAAVRVPVGGPAAEAHLWLGLLVRALGEEARRVAHYSAAVAAAGDPLSRAAILALAGRSLVRHRMGQLTEAVDDAERALELARRSGDQMALVRALAVRGGNAYYAQNDQEALTWYQQAADRLTTDIPGYLVRMVRNFLATTHRAR